MELEQENAFYETHREEFRTKYYNKYLLIADGTLQGTYDKFAEAAKTALKDFGTKRFIIHRPADEDKIIEIGPRIHTKYLNNGKPKQTPKITVTDGSPLKVMYAY